MHKGQKFTIKVTKTDIAKGEKMSGESCPIARAAQRATGANLRMGATLLYEPGSDLTYVVPEKVQRWIVAFDTGKPVKPFQFTATFSPLW